MIIGLIVYRIYKIQSRAANHTISTGSTSSPYSRLIRTLVECGAMYTASIIVLFACYLADSNAILPVSNSVRDPLSLVFLVKVIHLNIYISPEQVVQIIVSCLFAPQ